MMTFPASGKVYLLSKIRTVSQIWDEMMMRKRTLNISQVIWTLSLSEKSLRMVWKGEIKGDSAHSLCSRI
jgi:hypothetical protein